MIVKVTRENASNTVASIHHPPTELEMKPAPRHCLFVSLLVSALICCTGCRISTFTGGSNESPDGKYVVYGHTRGAGGRAYIDDTKKTVFITIETKGTQRIAILTNYQNGAIASETAVAVSGKPGKPLLEKKSQVRGSDVCWDATWGKGDSLTLFFYDYGPGVSYYAARKNGTRKREIRVFHYVLDAKSGRFVEQLPK
jgi:hypothetical protein